RHVRYLSDAVVAEVLPIGPAVEAVERAFRSLASGSAALQHRVRTSGAASKLSTIGAVLDDDGLLGAKVYSTTADGRFSFLVLLFDAVEGRPLALLDAEVLTAQRTAATSIVAARHLA